LRFNEIVLVVGLLACACGGDSNPVATAAAPLDTSVASLHAGQVVDSVPCLTQELPAQHIHIHLVVLEDGASVTVPAGIGVGRPWGVDPDGFVSTGSCFAWIHTHDTTGVVHIVGPEEKTYNLGQLFSVWGHPLAADGAFNFTGPVAVVVNGVRMDGDPRGVQLANFFNIVVELGKAPETPPAPNYNFSSTRR
jgi:hypothetical protein